MNLQLVNGTGSTASANGTGNLILGYQEFRPGEENVRSGSHNLVVGRGHNFTSFGGIVAGRQNTLSGPFASVTGGSGNEASGEDAVVGGGCGRTADGFCDWRAGQLFQDE